MPRLTQIDPGPVMVLQAGEAWGKAAVGADDELLRPLGLLERLRPGGQWTTARPVGTSTPAGVGDRKAAPLLPRTPDSINEHPAAAAMVEQENSACCCACCADQVLHAEDEAPGTGCGPGAGPVELLGDSGQHGEREGYAELWAPGHGS